MGRFAVLICWVFWLSIVLPLSCRAAKVDWLYDVDVGVANQSPQELGSASRQALLVVLKRVTGLVEIPMSDALSGALASPQRYYAQYTYRQDPGVPVAGQPGAKTLVLSVHFAEAAVQRLVAAAGLPLWSNNRPTTVAWIVVDENGDRSVLGASDTNPLLLALQARAKERGLPLVVPLMDQDEQLEVSAAVVWSGMVDVIEPASQRYAAEKILLGRITHAGNGSWAADWQIREQGNDQRVSVGSATAQEAGAAIADRLANDLVARYGVAGGDQQQLRIRINGVGTAADYGALLTYLGGLDFVDALRIDEVSRSEVLVSLATRTQWDRLRDLFALDGRLEPAQQQGVGDPLLMTWRGARPR